MATVVPYSATPAIQPQQNPTPFRQLNVPADAFGAATAAATERLGRAESQVGDELYTRALGMQELNERARSNEAVANTQNKQLLEWQKFRELPGDQAVQQLPAFMQQLDQMRRDGSSGLSPYARSFYDNEVRSSQFWMNRTASAHAAEENKRYVAGSALAVQESAKNNALANPEGPLDFRAIDAATELANPGVSPGELALKKSQARSSVASAQIMGLVQQGSTDQNKLLRAKELMEKYGKDKTIVGEDYNRLYGHVQALIEHRAVAQSASAITNGVGAGGGGFSNTIISPERARSAVQGMEKDGRGYRSIGPDVTKGDYKGQNAWGVYGIMPGNLDGRNDNWLAEARAAGIAVPATISKEDFLNNVDGVQDKLFDFKFGQMQKKYGSAREAARHWFGLGPDDGYTTSRDYLAKFDRLVAQSATFKEKNDAAVAEADRIDPGNPVTSQRLQDEVRRQDATRKAAAAEDKHDALQTLARKFTPGDDGKLITNPDSIYSDPDALLAFRKLDTTEQNKILKSIQQNAAHGGYAETDQNRAEYNRYLGIASDQERTPEETLELLQLNIPGWAAPQKFRDHILQVQNQMKKATIANPAIGPAMKATEDIWSPSGLSSKGSSRNEYLTFQGALEMVMQQHQQTYAKPMSRDEVRTTVQQMTEKYLYQKAPPGLWRNYGFWDSLTATSPQDLNYDEQRMYQRPMTTQDREATVSAIKRAKGPDFIPSENYIKEVFLANLWRTQFGPQRKVQSVPLVPAPSAGGPR